MSKEFKPRTIIIGAGMSGILMGYRLMQAGHDDFTIYEKGASCGGTWRENTYPGLHCDVKSHSYRYSFAPNPDWTEEFPAGPEIWNYFNRQAKELGVLEHIRFNTEVADGRWDGARWQITLKDGSTDVADILVSATGFLHQINWPDIPGLDSFEGTKFHTARWDHSVSLEDKRIAVVGTGSTATQITAELAGKVKKFYLFQRTAQWVLNVPNEPYSSEQREEFRANPELMQAILDETTTLNAELSAGLMYPDAPSRAQLIQNAEDNLATVADPDLRRRLTPDYPLGCKRMIMSPNFYEAIQRPNTELIDSGIERVVPEGILTKDGRTIELDLLVLATGFHAQAYVRPVTLHGENGVDLDDVWAKRPIAYQTMTVPQMPNFFMIGGPYSPVGNISLVTVSELQSGWIMECIDKIAAEGISMSPTQAATDAMVDDFRIQAKKTTWYLGGCSSWYLDDEGVPGIYPYPSMKFMEDVSDGPDFDAFIIKPLPEHVAA